MRFLNRRRILIAIGAIVIAFLALIGVIAAYLGSTAFHLRARQYIAEQIARRTGTQVTLADFHWSLWHEAFILEGLTLRGLEPVEEAPLAHFDRIQVGINLRTLLESRIDLSELTLVQPEFHLLVTQDGKTNIPSPPQESPRHPFQFSISVGDCKIRNGSALVNEQRIHIDFSVQNLEALLRYFDQREVLETHLQYDGVFDRVPNVEPAIPYTFTGDIDYTRGSLVAQQIRVSSEIGRAHV